MPLSMLSGGPVLALACAAARKSLLGVPAPEEIDERSGLSLKASVSGQRHALCGVTGSVHVQEKNPVPFVSKTGFLNSDGSSFTAHIATNVSSSLIFCHPAAWAHCCVFLLLEIPFPGWGLLPCQSLTLQGTNL